MKILTRMGDNSNVEFTKDELRQEFIDGSEFAAKKAKVPPLTENEIDFLVDMFCAPTRIWGVQRGNEVVMTKDGCVNALNSSQMSSGVVAPVNREVGVRLFESMLGFDSMEIAHNDYSVKPQRFLKKLEMLHVEILMETTIFPLLYGFMPNLGLYFKTDGPFDNPYDLMQQGKIRHYGVSVEKVEEALKAIEYPNVQTVQIIFNMFRHRPAELFFEQALKRRVGILARVPLASGLLTGKMRADSAFAAEDHRAFNRAGEAFDRGETFSGVDYAVGLRAVEALREVCPAGMSLTQFALRWILMFDAVTCAIPGAKRPAQAEENFSAADLPPLTEPVMAAVRAVYDRWIRPEVHHRW